MRFQTCWLSTKQIWNVNLKLKKKIHSPSTAKHKCLVEITHGKKSLKMESQFFYLAVNQQLPALVQLNEALKISIVFSRPTFSIFVIEARWRRLKKQRPAKPKNIRAGWVSTQKLKPKSSHKSKKIRLCGLKHWLLLTTIGTD